MFIKLYNNNKYFIKIKITWMILLETSRTVIIITL